jgi:hypothetical protein
MLAVTTAATTAHGAGYTVYILNTRNASACWIRTGFAHDLYTSRTACQNSINSRIAENRRNRTDYEKFAIVYTTCAPPTGCLTNKCNMSGQIVYEPAVRQQPVVTCLYWAKVYYNGSAYRLGDYTSADIARTMAANWVRGVGSRASFRNEVYKECK